ncbi:hypothetical protein DFH28DRAFT_1085173 [Melampsora americana]|nr:hypothetical protein DFH28DRAFT_1085173 [Melampsora americana]
MKLALISFTQSFIVASSLFVLGLEQKVQFVAHRPSSPELLEGSGLTTQKHFSDTSGITRHCPSSSKIKRTPYLEFFTTTHSVATFSKNLEIIQLAHKIVQLITPPIPSSESWELFFQRNELQVTECLEFAEKALAPTHDLDESERLWAVGIVAALSLPESRDGIISERSINGFYDWSPQVYLEIQATKRFEPFMTANFRSIWFGGKPLPRDNAELKECLKRAELFGKLAKGKSRSNLAKNVPSELLDIQLPESQVGLEKLVKKFRNNFKTGTALDWKGNLLVSLFQHLLEHSSQIRATVQQQIQDHEFFKDINKPYAQKDLSDMLKNLSMPKAVLNLSDSLSQAARGISLDQYTSHFIVYTILNVFARGESAYTKEQIHLANKVLLAVCFIEPSAEEYLINSYIEKEANVPKYLTHVYLKDVRRKLSAQNMLQSKSKSVQGMGSFLELLPRVPGTDNLLDQRLEDSISKEYENVSTTLQKIIESPSTELHLEMCFEFLFHLTEYNKEWISLLLEKIHSSMNFKQTMQYGANSVLQRHTQSWDQALEGYHVKKDVIHAFLKRLLLFCDQIWKRTASWGGYPPEVVRDPRWLCQDKKITIELFDQTFSIQESSMSPGKKRSREVFEEGESAALVIHSEKGSK